jgi:hypothetical protein
MVERELDVPVVLVVEGIDAADGEAEGLLAEEFEVAQLAGLVSANSRQRLTSTSHWNEKMAPTF